MNFHKIIASMGDQKNRQKGKGNKMKRILIILLIIIFTAAVSMNVAAQNEDLNGYEFNIQAVDQMITAESGLILTSPSTLASSGAGWSILIHCAKVSGNVYTVKADPVEPSGTIPNFTFASGDIVIAIHSSTSNPDLASTYPNVMQKLNALKLKAGMYITLKNIDLAAKTANNGIAVVSTTKPDTGAKDYTDLMGEMVENPQYKLDVTAPATYKPGDTLNVTITLKNVVPETGLSLVHFYLYYDPAKVEPVVKNDNSMNTEMEKFLVTAPNKDKWEGISKLEEDQNRYNISFATADNASAAKADGSLVITVPFMVKSTATGTIASQVPHKMTEALDNNLNRVYGNGGIALSTLSTGNVTSVPNNVQTGDFGFEHIIALSIIMIASVTATLNTRLRRKK
jgi:hypothetical protein